MNSSGHYRATGNANKAAEFGALVGPVAVLRRDRDMIVFHRVLIGMAAFVVAGGFMAVILLAAISPTIPVQDGWTFFEHENGGHYYVKDAAVTVIKEVPEDSAKILGYRTLIRVQADAIYSQQSAAEIHKALMQNRGEATAVQPIRKELPRDQQ